MRKASKVLVVVLVLVLVLAVLAAPAYAAKGGQGKGKGQDVRHKETGDGPYTVDPCEVRGDCGNGDHGKGDPEDRGRGSEHANCNAAQGEVDPLCEPPPPPPPPPPPEEGESEGGEEEPEEGESGETVQVCLHSTGNAVEVSDAPADDIPDLLAEPDAFEATVITEGWNVACWDAGLGSTWHVLTWNPDRGHAGAVYRVDVGMDATNAELHNPFLRIEVNGVSATRISPSPAPTPAY